MLAADLGDVPTWISAATSMLALIGAGFAAWQGYRIYRLESVRDAVAQAEQRNRDSLSRRAQAALVSGWWGYGGDGEPDSSDARRWGAFVRNASELPVFQATVTIVNRTSAELAESFALPAIPPAGQPVFHRLRGSAQEEIAHHEQAGRIFDYRVVLAFSDSSGARWIRDQHGALHECDGALTVLLDHGRSEVLAEPLNEFAARYGVSLTLRTMDFFDLQPEFLAAASSGDPPDIVIGVHDWLGNLVQHDAIEPLELPAERRAGFSPLALGALTRDGQLWGVPYAVENLALIRNTALVPQAPATLDELIEVAERIRTMDERVTHLMTVPMGPAGDAYHAYPLFAAAGGFLVRSGPDGAPEVGVDSPGGIAAFSRLRELGEQGLGLLRRTVTTDAAIPIFVTGRTPFLLSGPWSLPRIRRTDVPYAISPVPPFAGGPPATPLIGVPAAFLAKGGRNRELARHVLIEVLCRTDVANLIYRAEPRPPAQPGIVTALDEDTARFEEAGQGGALMPNGPAVIQIFDVFGRAVAACVGGAPAEPTARSAGREIRRLIAATWTGPAQDGPASDGTADIVATGPG